MTKHRSKTATGMALGLALAWAWPAMADYQAGADAYYAKNFATAMAEWMALAQAGDALAQNSVGALYDHGLGVEENDAEAVYWYRSAAEQGLALAMRNLGEKYLTGHGVPFDPALADQWLRKAASLGDPVAIQRLAAPQGAPSAAPPDPQPTPIFADGVGTGQTGAEVPAPPPEPTQQANVQAAPADIGGLWILGQWQGPSLGCPPGGGIEFQPDRVLSYYQGTVSSALTARYRVNAGTIGVSVVGIDGAAQEYEYRRMGDTSFEIAAIPESMPQSMIGVAFQRCGAAPGTQQAASSGSEFGAALDPETGFEILPTPEPEPEAATASVAQPAPAPEPEAPASVAEPAPAPAPTAPQPSPAIVASTQSAQSASSAPANALQAGWQAFGRGDSLGAIALWQPEAEAGNAAVQVLIGSIHDYGQGVPQDDAEAIKWYRKAAARGSAKAQFLLGAVYARSTQIKDSVKGLAWLKVAQRTLAQGGQPEDDVGPAQVEQLARQVAAQMSSAEIAQAEKLANGL